MTVALSSQSHTGGYKKYLTKDSTIIVGNGINRLYRANNDKSWEAILSNLDKDGNTAVPEGYHLTEYIEIINSNKDDMKNLKTEFVKDISYLNPNQAHYDLVDVCMKANVNILTTNFDHTLEKTKGFMPWRDRSFANNFSSYYPWQRYYHLSDTSNSIRIWHINGDYKYIDSIKLSVSDYSGCLQRFQRNNPNNKESEYEKDRTWINELMENHIVIVGLGLTEAEFFLRYILIQRALYNKKAKKSLKGYYLTKRQDCHSVEGADSRESRRLKFFLDRVGIETVEFDDYLAMYGL